MPEIVRLVVADAKPKKVQACFLTQGRCCITRDFAFEGFVQDGFWATESNKLLLRIGIRNEKKKTKIRNMFAEASGQNE